MYTYYRGDCHSNAILCLRWLSDRSVQCMWSREHRPGTSCTFVYCQVDFISKTLPFPHADNPLDRCSVPLQFMMECPHVVCMYVCGLMQPACKVGLWSLWCNHASSCHVAHAGQCCRQLTTHRMRVCSIPIVLNSCTSFLLTTQLESGNWRERATTHVNHRCGYHSLSPITVQRGSFSPFKLCS